MSIEVESLQAFAQCIAEAIVYSAFVVGGFHFMGQIIAAVIRRR